MSTASSPSRIAPGAITRSPRGTIVEVVEWSPERLKIRRTLPANTGKGAAHYHEDGTETFTVIEGTLTGAVDGASRTLQAGDVLHVPMGSSHVHPHTGADGPAVIEHVIEGGPQLGGEIPRFPYVYFASWLAWLEAGEVDAQEEPSLLQIMAVLRHGGGGSWVSGPPVAAQRLLAATLGRVAGLRGIRTLDA